MGRLSLAITLGCFILGSAALVGAPAYADDEVAALVVDNGSGNEGGFVGIPEPTSLALLATGLVALGLGWRRRHGRRRRHDRDNT